MAKRTLTSNRDQTATKNLGSIDAELAKTQLARKIVEAIEARGLTQAATAALLGIDQPKVSRLLHNRLSEFSASRLLRFITLLGRDIEIVIHPTRQDMPGQQGNLRVTATNEANV